MPDIPASNGQAPKQEKAAPDMSLARPKLFTVVFNNDDYTAMDFVVDILLSIFSKTHDEAVDIMLKVHNEGSAVVDTYTYDIAMTKKFQADVLAESKGYPLKITVEVM